MSVDAAKLTPMMQQYFEVKRGLPRDTLLLFRLGDFFEMFFDDAGTASRLLALTLTRRQEHPMAGSRRGMRTRRRLRSTPSPRPGSLRSCGVIIANPPRARKP